MGAMLSNAGFLNVQTVGAYESQIKGWDRFALDENQDGSIYKLRSLYMEAEKPAVAAAQSATRWSL